MNESEKILKLNINLLVPNKYQPRTIFNDESLKELSESIKEYGILNPILVKPNGDKYEIIAGERRVRAAILAGLTEVPVIVKNIDDSKLAELALIENLQRENISPIEEAKSYETILNLSSITEQKLSEMVGKSQSFISNKLRLLKLPDQIQKALAQRKISERHARSLMTISDKERQIELLNKIINEKLTVKELDNIINEKKITEEEIQSTINDIMKSLNVIDEEKKEEKESDNMNNGSFFPNMNQNMPQGGQLNTLNSMNMEQISNSQPMPTIGFNQGQPQENQMIPPQINQNPIPEISTPVPPIQEEQPTTPMTDAPLFGGLTMAPPSTPNLELPQGEPVLTASSQEQITPQFDLGTVQPQENPTMPPLDLPLNSEFSAPITPIQEEKPTTPMIDTPLFNNAANMTQPLEQETINEPIYEVPVNISPAIENQNNPQEKLMKVQEFLNNNGIEYKSYSNEIGHCIIIEM